MSVKATSRSRKKNPQQPKRVKAPRSAATHAPVPSSALPVVHREEVSTRIRPSRKYLTPAMLDTLIQESPVPPAADRGPGKPPFELQEH